MWGWNSEGCVHIPFAINFNPFSVHSGRKSTNSYRNQFKFCPLWKRAEVDGIDIAAIESAEDEPQPKQAIISLILAKWEDAWAAEKREQLEESQEFKGNQANHIDFFCAYVVCGLSFVQFIESVCGISMCTYDTPFVLHRFTFRTQSCL